VLILICYYVSKVFIGRGGDVLFQEQLIILQVRAPSAEDIIRTLGEIMFSEGYVKETFIASVLDREKEFATGLPLGEHNIAIPHTDSVHVNKQAIAIGVLQSPVEFHVMGSPEQVIPVDIVFLMAIKEQEDQVKYLQTFAELLQDPLVPERIYRAKSASEIVNLLLPQFQP
jgi:PTS system galactitol-specific IIA component